MRSCCLLLVVAFLLLSGVTTAVAGDPFAVINSVELKAMIDRNEPGLILVDTRSNGEYQEAHIKGALSIPWSSLEKDPSIMNFPKESKLLFYCTGSS